MKKCSGNKSSSSVKKTKGSCKICQQNSSCHSKPSGMSLNQTKSAVSTKISTTSFSNKGGREQNEQCSCAKKPNNSSILNMITEDKVCMCNVFANAFNSDIHMHMGTYIHQGESESNSMDNIIDYD